MRIDFKNPGRLLLLRQSIIDYFFVVCGIGNVKSHDAGCTLFCEAFVHIFFIALIMAFFACFTPRAFSNASSFSPWIVSTGLIFKTVPIYGCCRR